MIYSQQAICPSDSFLIGFVWISVKMVWISVRQQYTCTCTSFSKPKIASWHNYNITQDKPMSVIKFAFHKWLYVTREKQIQTLEWFLAVSHIIIWFIGCILACYCQLWICIVCAPMRNVYITCEVVLYLYWAVIQAVILTCRPCFKMPSYLN